MQNHYSIFVYHKFRRCSFLGNHVQVFQKVKMFSNTTFLTECSFRSTVSFLGRSIWKKYLDKSLHIYLQRTDTIHFSNKFFLKLRNEKQFNTPLNIVFNRPFRSSGKLKIHGNWKWDLLCVRQSDAAPFSENYARLYFGAEHLEKELNRDGEIVGTHFFKKVSFLANIGAALIFLSRPWYLYAH